VSVIADALQLRRTSPFGAQPAAIAKVICGRVNLLKPVVEVLRL
jgi:hypothetical protein